MTTAGRYVLGALIAGIMVFAVINAAYLQSGKHPAPLLVNGKMAGPETRGRPDGLTVSGTTGPDTAGSDAGARPAGPDDPIGSFLEEIESGS